jgi:hypothetical protein
MSKQYNKSEKRRRRTRYLKRLKGRDKTNASGGAKPKTAA